MSRAAPIRASLGGALASAILLIFAGPPFDLLPLPFLALVPMALAISSLPQGRLGQRSALLLGGSFGVAFWGWSLIWVPVVVGPRFPWAFPGYLLQVTLLGCLAAVFAWLAHRLHRDALLPMGLALPLAWVGVEWVKNHFPLGLAFPWLGLAISLTGSPRLLGIAEWVGEEGVAFWLAGVAGVLATALRAGRSRRSLGTWILTVVFALLPAAAGLARAGSLVFEEGPMVAVVGTRVPTALRDDPRVSAEESLSQVQEALEGVPGNSWDLVLLPEGVLPLPLGSPGWDGLSEALRTAAGKLGAPVVFGTLGVVKQDEGVERLTNSAVLLPFGGRGIQRYDKVRLVPGMEAGAYVAGSGDQIFFQGGWGYGPLVCYESLFSGLARRARNSGSAVLLNLTSDIWFGHPRSLVGSLFLQQHPAHLVLRAVETRTPVARAANGGYSLLMDPLGEVLSSAGPTEVGIASGRLPVYSGATLYSRTGDFFGPACILVCVLLLFLSGGGLRVGTGPRGRTTGPAPRPG